MFVARMGFERRASERDRDGDGDEQRETCHSCGLWLFFDEPTQLGELGFERGVLVYGFDELFRVGLVGIVLRPG